MHNEICQKKYLDRLQRAAEIVFKDSRPGKGQHEIDELFFIFLAKFDFYMKNGNYEEANNSLTDLFCYNIDERARYLINCSLEPYKEIIGGIYE